jgi:hypothetical protein
MFLDGRLTARSPKQAIRSHLARARQLDRALLDLEAEEPCATPQRLLDYWRADREAERHDAYARAIAREHGLDDVYGSAIRERVGIYAVHAFDAGDH